MTLRIKKVKEGIQFAAAIQPRASKNEICGILNGALKIRLTAPPVDGEANRTCVKFLAKFLGVSPSCVHIVSGHTGKHKNIQIEGMDEASLLKIIFPKNPAEG